MLNTARLVGLLFIVGGLLWSSYFPVYKLNFLAGMLIGTGVAFLLTGKFQFWEWRFPESNQEFFYK